MCEAINTGDSAWGFSGVNPLPGGAVVSISDDSEGAFPTISGSTTYGYLKFESSTSGITSSVDLSGAQTAALLVALNPPLGSSLVASVTGTAAGLQNSPTEPTQERERLLTHLLFSPVLKSANRTLTITYTITISVARTES